MNLKTKILDVLGLTDLKAAADAARVADVDRRSNRALRQALSRNCHVTTELLLGVMPEARVKALCEHLGVNSVGRKGALIRRLVDGDTPAKPATAEQSDANPAATSEPPSPPIPPLPPPQISVTKTELGACLSLICKEASGAGKRAKLRHYRGFGLFNKGAAHYKFRNV